MKCYKTLPSTLYRSEFIAFLLPAFAWCDPPYWSHLLLMSLLHKWVPKGFGVLVVIAGAGRM